jgi:hypothetical protein
MKGAAEKKERDINENNLLFVVRANDKEIKELKQRVSELEVINKSQYRLVNMLKELLPDKYNF